MKKLSVLFLVILAALVASAQALAQPGSGLGLYAGFSQSTLKSGPLEIDTDGPSFGIDYQFALNDLVSISPFYTFSDEEGDFTFSGIPFNADLEYTILGVQVRFWFDGFFVGGHAARYELDFTFESGGISGSGSEDGTGAGVIIGWEGENGIFVTGQYDSASLEEGDKFTGTRVHVGFRFK